MFASKTVSAGGIIGAGTIVPLVGLDGVTTMTQVTHQIRLDLAAWFLPVYLGLCVLALVIVSRYGIDRVVHNRNLQALSGQPLDKVVSGPSGRAA